MDKGQHHRRPPKPERGGAHPTLGRVPASRDARAETKPIARKERERARHRAEVLRAAEELLLSSGLHEITMQEVALKAEFSVGYLYRLFASKDELFAELIRQKHEELHALLLEEITPAEGPPVRERLLHAVLRTFAWLNDNLGYAAHSDMDFILLVRSHPELEADLRARNERTDRAFIALFRQAVARGELAAEEPETIQDVFSALVSGLVHERMHKSRTQGLAAFPKQDGKEKDPSAYATLIVSVIMRAFAPRSDRG